MRARVCSHTDGLTNLRQSERKQACPVPTMSSRPRRTPGQKKKSTAADDPSPDATPPSTGTKRARANTNSVSKPTGKRGRKNHETLPEHSDTFPSAALDTTDTPSSTTPELPSLLQVLQDVEMAAVSTSTSTTDATPQNNASAPEPTRRITRATNKDKHPAADVGLAPRTREEIQAEVNAKRAEEEAKVKEQARQREEKERTEEEAALELAAVFHQQDLDDKADEADLHHFDSSDDGGDPQPTVSYE